MRFSEKLPRPLGADTLTQFGHPLSRCRKESPRPGQTRLRSSRHRSAGAERSRRIEAEPPAAVQCPTQPVQKRPPPSGLEHAHAVRVPAQPVQRKEPPVGANPPAAVRVPYTIGAEKFLENFPKKLTIHGQFHLHSAWVEGGDAMMNIAFKQAHSSYRRAAREGRISAIW